MPGVLVALAQLNSQPNVADNLAVVSRLVAEAAGRGASMVVLPENFAIMGASEAEKVVAAEVLVGDARGVIIDTLRELASAHRVAIIGGGMPEVSDDIARPYNSCVCVDAAGQMVAVYRKIHLFDVDLADGTAFTESAYTSAGRDIVVCELAGVKLGLGRSTSIGVEARQPLQPTVRGVDDAPISTVRFTLSTSF